jgi:hypothetical protein
MEQTCEWIRGASGGSDSVKHLQRRNESPPLRGGLMEQTYGDAFAPQPRSPLPLVAIHERVIQRAIGRGTKIIGEAG